MIEINNLTKLKINLKEIKKFLQSAIKELKIKKSISLALINTQTIKKLNEIYRGQNKTTDVLSFSGDDNYLGEIIICLKVAQSQAKQKNHSLEKEIKILLVHGLLHLLGYDHENKKDLLLMKNKECKILSIIKT
jgi:probable rRNA maturation factor